MAYRHTLGVFDPKFRSNRQRRELEEMLSEWYGKPIAANEITKATEAPRKLGELLDELINKTLDSDTMATVAIQERWSEIIGPPLNKFVLFYNFHNNIITVEVTHPAFLQELKRNNHAQLWRERLNKEFPEIQIDGINFVPAGQASASQRNR